MAENMEKLKKQLSGLQQKYSEIEEMNKSLNERIVELDSLYQISLMLSHTFDLEEILKQIRNLIRKVFQIDQYSIMLLDELADQLEVVSSFGISKTLRDSKYYEIGKKIFGKAIERRELIYVPEIKKETAYEFYISNNNGQNGAFITIPLIPDNNHPIGVINVYRKQANSFSKREISFLSRVADQVAKVIDKTLLFKHTKELSITDELTGINNRRYFNQRYEREVLRAKRYKRPLTVLMIDIDYFKNYNDINGHILGDEILKQVANILENSIRKADILARYGGEEFILLLPEIDKNHAYSVAEKLRRAIEAASFPEEHTQPGGRITISVGVSTLLEDTFMAQELLDYADKALYEAKKLGRNQVVEYHPGLNGNGDRNYYAMKVVA